MIISGNITPSGGVSQKLSDHIAELDSKVDSKANISDIPSSTSQLINDSGFITDADFHVITTSEIDELCGLAIYSANEKGHVARTSVFGNSTLSYDEEGNVALSLTSDNQTVSYDEDGNVVVI